MDRATDSYLNVRVLNDEEIKQVSDNLDGFYVKPDKTHQDFINFHSAQILLSYNILTRYPGCDADSYLTVRLLNDESFNQFTEKLDKLYVKSKKTQTDYVNVYAIQILLSYNSIENQLFDIERLSLQDKNVENGIKMVVGESIIHARKLKHRLMNREYVHVHPMHEEKYYILMYDEFIEKLVGSKYRLHPGTQNQLDFSDRDKFIEDLSHVL